MWPPLTCSHSFMLTHELTQYFGFCTYMLYVHSHSFIHSFILKRQNHSNPIKYVDHVGTVFRYRCQCSYPCVDMCVCMFWPLILSGFYPSVFPFNPFVPNVYHSMCTKNEKAKTKYHHPSSSTVNPFRTHFAKYCALNERCLFAFEHIICSKMGYIAYIQLYAMYTHKLC